MPNIVAHNHVAYELVGESIDVLLPDVSLGTVLPDFAKMYRDKTGEAVEIYRIKGPVDSGIYIHKRTDKFFNDQLQVTYMTNMLSAQLEDRGIEYGAARIGSHMLVDIMLDAALLNQRQPAAHFETLTEYVLDGETTLHSGEFPLEFVEYVEGYFENNVAQSYADPEKLARIVSRRLAERAGTDLHKLRRRTIDVRRLPEVAGVIEKQSEYIHELGLIALGQTVKDLKASFG